MNDTKSALTSATVWGTIITGLSVMLMLAGVEIEAFADPKLPMEISAFFGALISLYGRLVATTEITGWFKG